MLQYRLLVDGLPRLSMWMTKQIGPPIARRPCWAVTRINPWLAMENTQPTWLLAVWDRACTYFDMNAYQITYAHVYLSRSMCMLNVQLIMQGSDPSFSIPNSIKGIEFWMKPNFLNHYKLFFSIIWLHSFSNGENILKTKIHTM